MILLSQYLLWSPLSVVVSMLCDPSPGSRKLLYRAIQQTAELVSQSHNNLVPLLIRMLRMLHVCVFLWQEQLTNPFKYWSENLLLTKSLDQDDCVITCVNSSLTSCSVNVSVCWLCVGNWKGPDYDYYCQDSVTWGNIFNLDTWQLSEKTNMKSFYGTSSVESHVHYHWTNKHARNW